MSVACGERVLLPRVRAASPRTIVVADGFSCREQIEQCTDRRALHPAQVLRMALDDRGRERNDELPERRFLPDDDARMRRIVARGYAALGCALLAGVVAAACAKRWR